MWIWKPGHARVARILDAVAVEVVELLPADRGQRRARAPQERPVGEEIGRRQPGDEVRHRRERRRAAADARPLLVSVPVTVPA